MKNILLLAIGLASINIVTAQDFAGSRTGNYAGVNGVFFNPASIAGSPYRVDVNLFSLNTAVANNQASFKLSNLSQSFHSDSIKNQLFGKNAGAATGSFTTDIHGPSAMFSIGKNNFAITTRARTSGTVKDIDGKLFTQLSNGFDGGAGLPYTLSSNENMRLAVNAWTEFGVSFGRLIKEIGPHSLRGGISVKYLAGAGNGYVNINKFNTTIKADLLAQDAYFTNSSGQISTGFGGMRISDFKASDLTKSKSTGIGTDIGFVYEFRPDLSKNPSGYKFHLGVSVLDLGSIRYKKDAQRSGAYDIHIASNQQLYSRQLNKVNIDDYNNFFASHPAFFTPLASNAASTYKVSLPTTMQLDADYHVKKGLFVSLAGQFSLADRSKAFNNISYTSFTLCPRYEMRHFGVCMPINYNQLSKMNAGLSVRFGPIFIGSGSIISSLVGQSKQMDFHFGARFSILK